MATILSDLIGTAQAYLKIGLAGVRLKNSAGVLHVRNAGDTAFAEVQADAIELAGATSGSTKLSVPADAVAELILPDTLPSTGQALVAENVAGSVVTVGYADVATGTNQVKSHEEVVNYNTASPIAIFTPPANARILDVSVEIETTFDAAGPSMSVGVAGTTSRYMGTTDMDLTTAAIYKKEVRYEEDGTPDEVIVTFVAGAGGSQGAARVTVTYANPG